MIAQGKDMLNSTIGLMDKALPPKTVDFLAWVRILLLPLRF